MRTMVLSLAVLAALGLAGCSGGGNGGQQQGAATAQSGSSAATAPISSSVSGTVGVVTPGKHPLSDKAKLTIKLVDVSKKGSAPLATKTVAPVSKLPVAFNFQLKPGQVNAADLYVVQAEMVDGIRHFIMRVPAPVLTKGASSQANIHLKAVPTPAEKMLAAFKKLQVQAGAMAIKTGTSRNSHVAHGWQVFRDKASGDIRYVVDQANYVKGGFDHVEYAFKDRKPWVVVRSHKASEHGKTTEIDRVGWDFGGKVVLNQKVVDGKTTKLDAAAAAKLYKQAEAMFAMAKKHK